MSCCDNSNIKIENNAGPTATILGISHVVGSLRGLSANENIQNGQTVEGQAFSGGGTSGAASGTITIGLATPGGIEQLPLQYSFTPDNSIGHCPCTAAANQPSTANFKAVASTVNGSSDGQAAVTWVLEAV